MNLIIIVLVGFFTQLSFAEVNNDDLAFKFKSMCETSYVKSLMGAKGKCHIVIAPKPAKPLYYQCKATLSAVPCEARLEILEQGYHGRLEFFCYMQDGNKMMDNNQPAEVFAYDVIAYVTTNDNQVHMIKDPKEYLEMSSDFLDVAGSKLETNTQKRFDADLFVSFLGRSLKLYDVNCQ